MRKAMTFMVPTILLLAAGAARADVIDGEWCHDDGRHFTIKGPEIVTPNGAKIVGTYSRHAFSYRGPDGGAPVDMRLVNERTVHLREGADPSGPIQVWTRCEPVS